MRNPRNRNSFLQYFTNTPLFVVAILLCISSNYITCVDAARLFNASLFQSFSPAVATWYGDPTGGGSGGACGYDKDVDNYPFNGMTSAGNQYLFKWGKNCGSCYQVKCTDRDNPACSGNLITVTITNECPGACNDDAVHFDLSGKAFGALSKQGLAENLRKAGRINVQYQRVPCQYKHSLAFKIDRGSNPYYMAFAVEFIDGDGDVGSMEILPANSGAITMQQSWGGVWKANIPDGVRGPFGVRITTLESQQRIFAPNVIPVNYWGQAGLNGDDDDDFDDEATWSKPIIAEFENE